MTKQTVLAIDLGAESGRVMAVHCDGQRLTLEELHRFANPVTTANGVMYWDFLHLWREIQAGIARGKSLAPASIGVDTWGVDFALLDQQDNLIGNVVNYRDPRTNGMMERAFETLPRAEIFEQTGIQFIQLNTLYQLLSLVESNSPQLSVAETFLTVPDLINFWLTGVKVCEFTNATTTQMLDPRTGTWAVDLLEKFGIPTHLFPEIVQPGTTLGEYAGIPVIAPATHDTGSAVVGVPTTTEKFAYISSGSWSLAGLELKEPIINAAALAANVTNEGGINNTYRLLKNIMGLWIVQQCRATWAAAGNSLGYDALAEMAEAAPQLVSLFQPDDDRFFAAGDHPSIVRSICRESGFPEPANEGAIIRAVLESLALRYRQVLDSLHSLAGFSADVIHVVGGGAQNHVLNQATANATSIPVVAGPVEATVLGNALVQFMALGTIGSLAEGRQMIADSYEMTVFTPEHTEAWQEAYERFHNL